MNRDLDLAKDSESLSEEGAKVLQTLLKYDGASGPVSNKNLTKVFIIGLGVAMLICVLVGIFSVRAVREISKAFTQNTNEIILTREDIQASNAWERLETSAKKERLKEQYYEIVRYYTNSLPPTAKMNDTQILATFNTLWDTTSRAPSVNFFLPVAYMKVRSNFNPAFASEYRVGIIGFYYKMGDAAANLPRVKTDTVFQTVFKGNETLLNPSESIKLLVAKIDDLMITFNGRVDWVLLSLFTNEYDVIANYWKGGEGSIPDDKYKKGDLAEALKYYQSFKNWTIPSIDELKPAAK